MNASSKWIIVESLEEPVTRVARRALKARLQWLWSRLPLAARDTPDNREHVHQLRVASRRATAAMETFAGFLPRRRAAWFDKQLKRIRHAAGEARDLDVLALRLQKEFRGDSSDAAEAIVARVSAARKQAQPDIETVYRRLRSRHFAQRIRKLVDRARVRDSGVEASCDGSCRGSTDCAPGCCGADVHGGCEPSIFAVARDQVQHLADGWFAAAESDLSDTRRLHLFRIAGKRLRYGMEIFAAALGSDFRKSLYPQVEEILELLGQINDRVASEARLQVWLNETDRLDQRRLLAQLLASDAQAISAGLHEFFQIWTIEHRDALHAQFARELVG